MKGYATVVVPKAMCASACGLIWLAGTSRAIMYDSVDIMDEWAFTQRLTRKMGNRASAMPGWARTLHG